MAIDVLQHGDLPFPRSLPEFQRLFPDEAACTAYLERARWNGGFTCPHCGATGEPYRITTRPGVLCCRKCRHDTRLTAGTVMEGTHTPLSVCSGRLICSPARYRAYPQFNSSGSLGFRATRQLSRFSTSCVSAWCAPIRTLSAGNLENMSRPTKPGWAAVRAEKDKLFHHTSSLLQSRCGNESPAPSSILEGVAATLGASGLHWCLTGVPIRSAASWHRVPESSPMTGAATPGSPSMAMTRWTSRH